MTQPPPLPPSRRGGARTFAVPALALLLFAVMLYSTRAILAPLVVFPVILLALWPLRRRADVGRVLGASAILTLFWFIDRYFALLGPFFVAALIAYLLAPAVGWLERHLIHKRPLAILATLLAGLLLIGLLLFFTVPRVWDQLTELISRLPQIADKILHLLKGGREQLARLPFLSPEQQDSIRNLDEQQLSQLLQQNGDRILSQLGQWALTILGTLWSLFGLLGYLVITPVVIYYLLRDWGRLLGRMESAIPPRRRPRVMEFLQEYDRRLGGWVRGQLTEATLVAVLTGGGLALLGVPNALLLGVISGLFNIIPYIGLVISVVPAALVALTMPDPLAGAWRVALVFGVVQFLDGSITGPRIVGDAAGLNPLWIMLALAVGGAVFGFFGLLLAVPLAILATMLGRIALESYRQSALYRGPAPAQGGEK